MRAALGLLVLAAAALGCGGAAERPNLVLLVSDTLRADALSCYGGPARTPNLCGLAERGTLFERAYSAAPWTLPSAVSLFTGSSASGFSDRPLEEPASAYHVPDAERLLGEALAERGYALRYDVENRVTLRANLFQGFEPLPPPRRADDIEDSRAVRMERTLEFLASPPEPFFLVRWGLDPHAPYAPPPERQGALAWLAEGLPRPLSFYASLGQRRAEHRLADHAPSFSAAELDLLRALYHAEVEWMDELVGRMIDALVLRGLMQRTLFVFTADHGEAFGEHGLFLHGHALSEPLLRVPLIVAGPGVAAGHRVSEPVSLTDLEPSLRELLGEPEPPAPGRGASFAGLLRGAAAEAGRVVYASGSKEPERGADALIVGSSKLVAHPGGRFALYDLAADPGEKHDHAAGKPGEVAALRERLEAIRFASEAQRTRRLGERSPAELETDREETERELRALGYVE
jgi:arylsulfatase A-like enzyme